MFARSNKNRLLLFYILIFPFIKPQLFDTNQITTYVYYVLKLFSSFLIIILFTRIFYQKNQSMLVFGDDI